MDEFSSVIEAIKESMVVTKLPNQGRGSGFFVNDKGLFITNKHTVELDAFIKNKVV